MRGRRRDKLQRELWFDPSPRVGLPEEVRREALSALIALLTEVMGEVDRDARDGGGHE